MSNKTIFAIFVCIMLGLGLFFIGYGIKGGLIERKMLVNAWRNEYAFGRDAVIRGIIYIFLGLLFLIVLTAAVIKTTKFGI